MRRRRLPVQFETAFVIVVQPSRGVVTHPGVIPGRVRRAPLAVPAARLAAQVTGGCPGRWTQSKRSSTAR